eukprot:767911-Hanusia_phi.AAC.2
MDLLSALRPSPSIGSVCIRTLRACGSAVADKLPPATFDLVQHMLHLPALVVRDQQVEDKGNGAACKQISGTTSRTGRYQRHTSRTGRVSCCRSGNQGDHGKARRAFSSITFPSTMSETLNAFCFPKHLGERSGKAIALIPLILLAWGEGGDARGAWRKPHVLILRIVEFLRHFHSCFLSWILNLFRRIHFFQPESEPYFGHKAKFNLMWQSG